MAARATPCNPDIPKPTKMPEAPKDRNKASALFVKWYKGMKGIRGAAEAAVDFYTGQGYIRINRELRKPGYLAKGIAEYVKKFGPKGPALTNGSILTPEQAAKHIAALDKLLASNGTPQDMLLFRGLSSSRIRNAKPGAVFSDVAYQSTSIRREVANLFAARAKSTGVVLEIEAPKGTRGAFVAGLSPDFSIEMEFLLPRGTTFQVLANDGKGTVRVRIVPMGED